MAKQRMAYTNEKEAWVVSRCGLVFPDDFVRATLLADGRDQQ